MPQQWLLAGPTLQAIQLLGPWRPPRRWPLASSAQGPHAVPTDLPGDGVSTGPGVGPGAARPLGTGRAVRSHLPPGSQRCRLTTSLRALSGTLMPFSSPSSTQRVTNMTPSSSEVGGSGHAIRGTRPGEELSRVAYSFYRINSILGVASWGGVSWSQ